MRVCGIPLDLFSFNFFYSVQFFESFSIRYKFDFVQQDKKAKEMSFKAV